MHHNTQTSTNHPQSNRGRFTVASRQNTVENQSKTCRFGAGLGPLFSPPTF
jgi:hypothetical protein